MAARKLADMAAERYDDPAVRDAVVKHAEEGGTAGKIESGELVLPSAQDAAIWHARTTGVLGMTPKERDLKAENDDLRTRLDRIEQRLNSAQSQPGPDHILSPAQQTAH